MIPTSRLAARHNVPQAILRNLLVSSKEVLGMPPELSAMRSTTKIQEVTTKIHEKARADVWPPFVFFRGYGFYSPLASLMSVTACGPRSSTFSPGLIAIGE